MSAPHLEALVEQAVEALPSLYNTTWGVPILGREAILGVLYDANGDLRTPDAFSECTEESAAQAVYWKNGQTLSNEGQPDGLILCVAPGYTTIRPSLSGIRLPLVSQQVHRYIKGPSECEIGKSPSTGASPYAHLLGSVVLSMGSARLSKWSITKKPAYALSQVPGLASFQAAYRHVNKGQEPVVVPSDAVSRLNYVDRVLRACQKGELPMEDLEEYGPTLVIGGELLGNHICELAAPLAQRAEEYRERYETEVTDGTQMIDRFAGQSQIRWAQHRIERYIEAGDRGVLLDPDKLVSCRNTPCTTDRELIRLFNDRVAKLMGVDLSEVSIRNAARGKAGNLAPTT